MNSSQKTDIPIVIVVGMSKPNRAIGKDNDLLWHVPEDLKRFKELTLGHPIILGRKTFESIVSILGKPLPGRTNIVITSDSDYSSNHQGVVVCQSIDEAIAEAKKEEPQEIHVGGGAKIYQQILPLVSRLHVTWYEDDPAADSFFPEFEDQFTIAKEYEEKEHNEIKFRWVDYVRK